MLSELNLCTISNFGGQIMGDRAIIAEGHRLAQLPRHATILPIFVSSSHKTDTRSASFARYSYDKVPGQIELEPIDDVLAELDLSKKLNGTQDHTILSTKSGIVPITYGFVQIPEDHTLIFTRTTKGSILQVDVENSEYLILPFEYSGTSLVAKMIVAQHPFDIAIRTLHEGRFYNHTFNIHEDGSIDEGSTPNH
jgi:hypothetical protein